jgi:hypothetical protein
MGRHHLLSALALIAVVALSAWALPGVQAAGPDRAYIGAEACQACHTEQYASFVKHSKKSRSFESVAKLRKGLSDAELRECFGCHTTGYGSPGGFESEATTPQLKNAGCEVCHGPGRLHAESQDPRDINGRLSVADCERCHSAERVGAFRYRPMIYGGAH